MATLIIAAIALAVSIYPTAYHYFLKKFEAPKIIVAVLPDNKLDLNKYGKSSIRNEFKLNKDKVNKYESHYNKNSNIINTLDHKRETEIKKFTCDQKTNNKNHNLYILPFIIQNIGKTFTKGKYELLISFNTYSNKEKDPGISVIAADGDDISLSKTYVYSKGVYSQNPNQLPKFPQCLRNEFSQSKEQKVYFVPLLVQKSYQNVGLVRSLVTVDGSLETGLFQTVVLLLKIPNVINKFIVIFQVECKHCSAIVPFKTRTYAQAIYVVHK